MLYVKQCTLILFRDVAGFTCILDGDGEVTDFLRLPHILKRKNPNAPEIRQDKENELVKLKEFIMEKKPHVIAVAGESRCVFKQFVVP